MKKKCNSEARDIELKKMIDYHSIKWAYWLVEKYWNNHSIFSSSSLKIIWFINLLFFLYFMHIKSSFILLSVLVWIYVFFCLWRSDWYKVGVDDWIDTWFEYWKIQWKLSLVTLLIENEKDDKKEEKVIADMLSGLSYKLDKFTDDSEINTKNITPYIEKLIEGYNKK